MAKVFSVPTSLEKNISQALQDGNKYVGVFNYAMIPMDRIDLDPENPRKLLIDKDDVHRISLGKEVSAEKQKAIESLRSLAHSINKSGLRHPIEIFKIEDRYQVISGERRLLSSILAGKSKIQARVLNKKPSESDLRLLQWIENIERKDLNLYEKIGNIIQLKEAFEKEKKEKITIENLKEIIGCSKGFASEYLSLATANNILLTAIKNQNITNAKLAVFIAKNVYSEDLLNKVIKDCSNGAGLENIKRMLATTNNDKQLKSSILKVNISLGSVKNASVIKKLIRVVSDSTNSQPIENLLLTINWNDPDNISKQFKKFLKLIEDVEV